MKSKVLFLLTFVATVIFSGCNSSEKVSSNALSITKNDEKMILEYLDTKTDDIVSSKNGKMYSSFKLLGTSDNKIYIWMSKVEYFYVDGKVTRKDGDAVSLPVVLDAKTTNNRLSIANHKYPEEGKNYGKSLKKLFPPYIKFPEGYERMQLDEATKVRAEEEFKKS